MSLINSTAIKYMDWYLLSWFRLYALFAATLAK